MILFLRVLENKMFLMKLWQSHIKTDLIMDLLKVSRTVLRNFTVRLSVMVTSPLLAPGVRQRTKRVPGVPEGPGENGRGPGRGRLAAHWGHWEMAPSKQSSTAWQLTVQHAERGSLVQWSCWLGRLVSERHSEDHRQKEAHFQAGAGRIHRAGEDRDRVHSERPRGPDIRPRRQLAGMNPRRNLNS